MKIEQFCLMMPDIKLDYVCPSTYQEIDHKTCESHSFGEGCKLIKSCLPYKQFKKTRGANK